jgi:sensor histidine kinase YesM
MKIKQKLKQLNVATFLGIVVILCMRICNDVYRNVKYWEVKSPEFLICDMIATIIVCYAFLSILGWWATYTQKHQSSLWKEYGVTVAISIAVISCYMLLRSYLQYHSFYSMKVMSIPLVVSALIGCICYGIMRHSIDEEENRRLQIEQAELKNEQLNSELRALRAQYHPHFLFNALNTIYFQIAPENETPRHTIEILSEILRYQINCGSKKVPLQKEIEYLEKDISFRKLRCSDSLSLKVDFSITEDDQNVMIYPLLFIPLVENAFKYIGGDELSIDIKMFKTGNQLTFSIINSVPPIDAQMPLKPKTGTGLANLRRRLSLLYPEHHTLEITRNNDFYSAKLTLTL